MTTSTPSTDIVLMYGIVHNHAAELHEAALIGLESPILKVVTAANLLLKTLVHWSNDRIVVAKHNGSVIGFSVYNVLQGDLHLLELGSLTTTPGVGTVLINEMARIARELGAQRILLNPGNSVGFYLKMGFMVIGRNLMGKVI